MENSNLYSIEFERSVLSSILFDPVTFEELGSLLSSDDFYLPAHQNIFLSMSYLTEVNKPIDEEFIKKDLMQKNCFDADTFLAVMMSNPISNTKAYVDEIVDKSRVRRLLGVTTTIKKLALEDNETSDTIISQVDAELNAIVDMDSASSDFGMINIDDVEDGETEFILKDWLPIPKGTVTIIAAPGGCVDGNTEFLTPTGWKKIENYSENDLVLQIDKDTFESSFVTPTQYVKELDEREAYVIDGGSRSKINMVLTAEHRVLYESKSGSGNKYRKVKSMQEIAENIYLKDDVSEKNDRVFNGKILSNFIAPQRIGIKLSDEDLIVMVAVLADGNFPHDRINNYCRINIKKDRKKLRLRDILQSAKIDFTEKIKDDGYSVFGFSAPMKEKTYKKFWSCNRKQLEIICSEFPYWDGSFDKRNGNRRFHTTIKEDADFIQYALSSTIKSVISLDTQERIRDKNFIEYTVRETSIFGKVISKSKLKKAPLKDNLKYCFTVDTSFWVARRGDYIFLTGNTGKSWTALQLAIRFSHSTNKKSAVWLSEDPLFESKSRAKAICKDILRTQESLKNIQLVPRSPMQLIINKKFSYANFYKFKKNFSDHDLIIFDPLLAFYGGEENDNSQARMFMQPFMDWAKETNKCIIFLHHSKKGNDGTLKSNARGAGAFVDAARTVYEINKIDDSQESNMREIVLTKDNYGVIKHLKEFKVRREITPRPVVVRKPIYVQEFIDNVPDSFIVPEGAIPLSETVDIRIEGSVL